MNISSYQIKDESFTTGMLRCSQRKVIPVWRIYRISDNTCVYTCSSQQEAQEALKELCELGG